MDINEFIGSFYVQYLDLVDRVLPQLTPSQQLIVNQMFARSIAVGQGTCSLSHWDIHLVTNLSRVAYIKALKDLKNSGFIEEVSAHSSRKSKEYRVILRETNVTKDLLKFKRAPSATLRQMGINPDSIFNIVENKRYVLPNGTFQLSDEQQLQYKITLKNLDDDDVREYRRKARRLAGENSDPEEIFIRLIFQDFIGPINNPLGNE